MARHGGLPAERRPQRALRRQRRGQRAAARCWPRMPAETWVHVEIEAAPRQERPAHLQAHPHARPAARRRSSPTCRFRGKDFRELHWLGFSSTAAADTPSTWTTFASLNSCETSPAPPNGFTISIPFCFVGFCERNKRTRRKRRGAERDSAHPLRTRPKWSFDELGRRLESFR